MEFKVKLDLKIDVILIKVAYYCACDAEKYGNSKTFV